MMLEDFNPTKRQQQAINQLDGRLFIAAGAGSGKTSVVANRFVEAIARGKAEVDGILTITFTKKAAAEMMTRIRKELREQMDSEKDPERAGRIRRAYRNIENTRISTIDSFYADVLKANALAAGLDPEFSVADETRSLLMRREAFDECLLQFAELHGAAGADFILEYDPKLTGGLFEIVNKTYDTLRSRGKDPQLPVPEISKEACEESFENLLVKIAAFEEAVVRHDKASIKSVIAARGTNQYLCEASRASDPDERAQLLFRCKPAKSTSKVKLEQNEIVEAWDECARLLRSIRAVDIIKLMNDLLVSFHEAYSEKKHDDGILDFADLSLFTRDLLVKHESIRKRLASSFGLVMVDEFQDTNPLQYEITRLIDNGDLMMVGDENQSIYGFRDAEVSLFQDEDRQSEAEGCRIPLDDNFRSQTEILAFVDEMFDREEMLGSRYIQLKPMAKKDPNAEDCRIEVLMVDTKPIPPEREKKLKADDCRKVEAQLIADRLLQLHESGYAYGDMAILMATRGQAEVYRDALDRADISNYLSIGISYYDRLELGDSINMFRLIVNPLDDEALAGVLRSPLAGVADDTLYWLRQTAGYDTEGEPAPLWPVLISPQALKRFSTPECNKLQKFAADLGELRDYALSHSLQGTARRVISWNDYGAATAAGKNGKQALANLMKLLDLAADFEAAAGRDIVAFTEFLNLQKSEGRRESDAPVEEEGVDSVRIMTMHAAKGLEFPLVVLPKLDAVKGGRNSKPVVLIDRDDSSGRVGLLYAGPDSEKRLPTLEYEELAAANSARELAEEKRLNYVAMTRAKKHLILVGSADLDKPGAGYFKKSRPFDWIRTTLSLDRDSRPDLDELPRLEDINGVAVKLQVCVDPETELQRSGESATAHDRDEARAGIDPAITAMPTPPVHVPATISPTAIDLFSACPRRYYLERIIRAGSCFDVRIKSWVAPEGCSLNAADRGSLVHHILEHDLELAFGDPLSADYIDRAASELLGGDDSESRSNNAGAGLTDKDREQIAALVARLGRAPVAATLLSALKKGELKRELDFSTLVGKTIISGFIDAICPSNGGSLVVDYKTGSASSGNTGGEKTDMYRYQMAAYALAAVRINPGPVKVVLVFLGDEEPKEIITEYTREQAEALEAQLLEVIDAMAPGDFPPVGELDAHQCHYCAAGPSGARICLPAAGRTE